VREQRCFFRQRRFLPAARKILAIYKE